MGIVLSFPGRGLEGRWGSPLSETFREETSQNSGNLALDLTRRRELLDERPPVLDPTVVQQIAPVVEQINAGDLPPDVLK